MVDEFLEDLNSILVDTRFFNGKKLSWLPSPPSLQMRKWYKLEGNTTPPILDLPSAASNFSDRCQLSFVARTNITVTSLAIEDFEAVIKFIVKVSSWMDWLLVTVQSLANSTRPDERHGYSPLTHYCKWLGCGTLFPSCGWNACSSAAMWHSRSLWRIPPSKIVRS